MQCNITALGGYCHYNSNDSVPANGPSLIFTQTLLSFSHNNQDDLLVDIAEPQYFKKKSLYSFIENPQKLFIFDLPSNFLENFFGGKQCSIFGV